MKTKLKNKNIVRIIDLLNMKKRFNKEKMYNDSYGDSYSVETNISNFDIECKDKTKSLLLKK